jgi:O-acetylserine/cysteine efflux transporter
MTIKDICLAIFVTLAWGSYFTVTKLALTSFPPLLFAAIRFFLLFLLTFPFLFKSGLPLKKIFYLSLIMFFNLVLLNYSIHSSSSLAPIILINEMAIPISSLFGILFLKEKFFLKDLLGMILAIIGITIIIKMRSVEKVSLLAVIFAVVASILFAWYNLFVKQLSKFNILGILAYFSLFVFPQFLMLSFFQETWPNIKDLEMNSIFAILYITLICTLIGYYIWFYLMKKYPMGKVVPFTFLSPLFGCITTAVILDEKIENSVLVGGILVIFGLSIIEFRRSYDKEKL